MEEYCFWKEPEQRGQKGKVTVHTGDPAFDRYVWRASRAPEQCRCSGCTGVACDAEDRIAWSTRWQRFLLPLILDPGSVKQQLLDNFSGICMDGTGEENQEDGYLWPLTMAALYLNQTGDLDLLLKMSPYFKGHRAADGDLTDEKMTVQRNDDGSCATGTVLEHLILQNLIAFYRAEGQNGNLKKDTVPTVACAENLRTLAGLLEQLVRERNLKSVEIAAELEGLLEDHGVLDGNEKEKRGLLMRYAEQCRHTVSGRKVCVPTLLAAESLRKKAEWLGGCLEGAKEEPARTGNLPPYLAVLRANTRYRRLAEEGAAELGALCTAAGPATQICMHSLTISGWYLLTVVTGMFGVKGVSGHMELEPQLRASQFDEQNRVWLEMPFGGRMWKLVFVNDGRKDCGDYEVAQVWLDGKRLEFDGRAVITSQQIRSLERSILHEAVIVLE